MAFNSDNDDSDVLSDVESDLSDDSSSEREQNSDDDLNVSDESDDSSSDDDPAATMLEELAKELDEHVDSSDEETPYTPGFVERANAMLPWNAGSAQIVPSVEFNTPNFSQPIFTQPTFSAPTQGPPKFVIQTTVPSQDLFSIQPVEQILTAENLVSNPATASKISQIGLPPVVVGTVEDNLKRFEGEPENLFNARSSIAKAIVNPPYNLSVREALIVSRIWADKGVHGVVYSKEIEAFLTSISSRAS